MPRKHSIRIPIHGFIEINDWERDIINHPVFQRLRRIRQLAFSEHLYPGSVHTRFEHSLGVMHIATRLYDTLAEKYGPVLKERLGVNPENSRSRTLVRLAGLLHDVGHAPFSHTGEELMLDGEEGTKLTHENYSAALIREEMTDVIDCHKLNRQEHNITGKDIADFYTSKSTSGLDWLFWRELVDGQLDADRMDYLLRDSHHCGVMYGHFDLQRILDTVTIVENDRPEGAPGLSIGIERGGRHAAEGLILARYMMFQQVYFHPVRKAYDHHAAESLGMLLTSNGLDGKLPTCETPEGRKQFLELDDWSVYSFIQNEGAEQHGEAIMKHSHDRCIHQTSEIAKPAELMQHESLLKDLRDNGIDVWECDADKEWYNVQTEIRVARSDATPLSVSRADPLSEVSNIVHSISNSKQRFLFAPKDQTEKARNIIKK